MAAKKKRRPVRWSSKSKTEVVLRLLRGEGLDELSRETGQPAGVLSQWRESFLDGGAQMLKRRAEDPVVEAVEAEKQRLQAKIGELTMDKELLETKIERLESNRPLARGRSKR